LKLHVLTKIVFYEYLVVSNIFRKSFRDMSDIKN